MIQRRNFLSRTLAGAASLGLLGAKKRRPGRVRNRQPPTHPAASPP